MPNPVEILSRARQRIARVAAARTAAYAVVPAIAVLALGLALNRIGHLTWERWGYFLSPDRSAALSIAMYAAAGLSILVGVALAIRTYLKASNFVDAAEQVDTVLNGRQQILTFATLADPDRPSDTAEERSPLFPVLWRRAIAYLEPFRPEQEFPLALGRPLARSSVLAAILAGIMILATLGLVRPPTPLQASAMHLREMAREIEKSATDPSDIALAGKVADAADALENPALPPEQKMKRLEAVMHDIEEQKKSKAGSEKGNGSGGSSQSAKGEGKGKGEGSGSGGAGTSEQAGTGKGKNGKGTGGGGESEKGKSKGADKSIELQNEIAKAEAQVETESATQPSPETKQGKDQQGQAPKPGTSPNEKGAGKQPGQSQSGQIPKQDASGSKNIPQTGGPQQAARDQGSNQGDTRLGEFPAPTKYQRFLKPGEKGASLDIHDARYVMFRLPTATAVKPGGSTVVDLNRPVATTPYVNAPLKEAKSDAPPDERQLIPPRYRELIH